MSTTLLSLFITIAVATWIVGIVKRYQHFCWLSAGFWIFASIVAFTGYTTVWDLEYMVFWFCAMQAIIATVTGWTSRPPKVIPDEPDVDETEVIEEENTRMWRATQAPRVGSKYYRRRRNHAAAQKGPQY